jgi:hypothetical protein
MSNAGSQAAAFVKGAEIDAGHVAITARVVEILDLIPLVDISDVETKSAAVTHATWKLTEDYP